VEKNKAIVLCYFICQPTWVLIVLSIYLV